MNKLFDIIDKLAPEIKDLWVNMAMIETPSFDKASIDSLGNLISSFAKEKGFLAKVHPFEEAGNGLVITFDNNSTEAPVALMGHMDTVHKKGAFGEIPVKEEDGFLKGPGVYDCKGGLSVAMLTMCALKEWGYNKRPVKLVLSPDEEVCAIYSKDEGKKYLRDNLRGSVMAINCESGSPEGKVVTGRKSVLRLKVTVKGKAAHAGSNYFDGISAIKEAAHKIIHIEEGSSRENITYNCGIIEGGHIANSVPETCSFVVDIRYKSADDEETAFSHVRKIAETSYIGGTTSTVSVISHRVPMDQTEGNLKLFEYVKGISNKYGFGELSSCVAGGGSDSCYSVMEGVPSLCAMGIEGHEQHTLRERAYISSLNKRAKLIAAAIVEYDK